MGVGFSGGSAIKNPPAVQGRQRLEFNPWFRKILWRRKMATHASILAWRIPWTEVLWAPVHRVTKSQTQLNN